MNSLVKHCKYYDPQNYVRLLTCPRWAKCHELTGRNNRSPCNKVILVLPVSLSCLGLDSDCEYYRE